MKTVLAWLEQRTGLARFSRELLYANIPGGPRWRYTWGGVVLFAIGIQFVTGLFLWMNYSPGAQTAWESVHFLQNDVSGGLLLRGLHHYTAQLLPVILALHLLQMVSYGAYRSPREVNFWLALLLAFAVMAAALTGYQLPWDQKGFWATKVAMNLLGIVPVIGPALQKILIGGPEYGHLTLTRFFAMHAGVLPAAILLLVALQAFLLRRHGFAGDESKRRPDAPFWPDQALRHAVVCLAFTLTVLFLANRHGAPLGSPADPSEPSAAARPEWYFLFLFQFLKLFPGNLEIWGAVVIPTLILLAIFAMPIGARSKRRHQFNVALLCLLLLGAAVLTWIAKSSDAKSPEYQTALRDDASETARVNELAEIVGIPATGALSLLHQDPLTQGPKLFARNCASCHRFNGHDGTGHPAREAQSASDLAGFASREWIARLLDPAHVGDTNHFGGTKFKDGRMVRFVKREVSAYAPEQKEQLQQAIAALSAEAQLKSQQAADQRDAALITAGRGFITGSLDCIKCHPFHDEAGENAPDLTGYGSRAWLVKFVSNPGHDDFYGDRNDRMPAFGEKQKLTPEAIGLIADWLRQDWQETKK